MTETVSRNATTRDRDWGRLLLTAGVAWLVIWTFILAFLFVYGDAIARIVV